MISFSFPAAGPAEVHFDWSRRLRPAAEDAEVCRQLPQQLWQGGREGHYGGGVGPVPRQGGAAGGEDRQGEEASLHLPLQRSARRSQAEESQPVSKHSVS